MDARAVHPAGVSRSAKTVVKDFGAVPREHRCAHPLALCTTPVVQPFGVAAAQLKMNENMPKIGFLRRQAGKENVAEPHVRDPESRQKRSEPPERPVINFVWADSAMTSARLLPRARGTLAAQLAFADGYAVPLPKYST